MRSGHLTILQINDTHGYLEPHPERVWESRAPRFVTLGGYATMAGYIRDVRDEREGAVLLLDNGDTFHGTYPVVHSKGDVLPPLLNALGFDAMTAHWDFAYGPEHLKSLVGRLSYPLLAINCFDKETGALTFPPTRVVERGGLRVGIIGIAATIVDKTMPPSFSEGVRLTVGVEELPRHIRQLREEEDVDIVVVLSHLGFPQDVKLAGQVPGIDVLLSGHTHNRLFEPVEVNGAAIIQSGCHGAFIGRLDITVSGGKTRVVHHALVPMDDAVRSDPAMRAMVDALMAPHRAMLDTRVGRTEAPLYRDTMLETTMDNFLLAAVAEAADTRIAFSNGWRYGAPVPSGDITMNDLWNIIPSNPAVSRAELTGRDMRAMLEENLEHTFAADPFAQMGGYLKRCIGITVHVKLENSAGQRIQHLFVGDDLAEPDQVYEVAYVTAQGVPPRFGRAHRQLGIHAIEAMRDYLAREGPIRPTLNNAVLVV